MSRDGALLLGVAVAAAAISLASLPAFRAEGAAAGAPVNAAAGAPDAGPGMAPAPPAAEPTPDLDLIIREAQRVQLEDTAAWPRFRFRRHVRTERLDADGDVTGSEELEFVVTPKAEGFDEDLQSIEGRQPTAKEVRRHRRLARFTRHYEAARSGEGSGALGGGYSLSLFLRRAAYRYAGREEIGGVPCHRLDFSPQEHDDLKGYEGRLASAMGGSLWISVDGYHLVRARTRMVRPVSIVLLLFRFRDLAVDLDSAPVAPGVWLPRRIEVRADARVSFWPLRRHSVLQYSDFTPAAQAPVGGAAGADASPGASGPGARPGAEP